MITGLRLALSLLTVLPAGRVTVDPRTARQAITLAPLVGLLLGGVAVAVLAALRLTDIPPLLAGLLAVAALALLTRGMHLDGLADTADGLGCYGPPERALAVMRDGGAGPFAVVTLIVIIASQATALAALSQAGHWIAIALALVTGRASFAWCCRRNRSAARPEGLGALVAGSQPLAVTVCWWLVVLAVSPFAVPGAPWLGPLAVVLAGTVLVTLDAHTGRRFGGLTGDVLGACCEVATTIVLVGCTLAG